MNTIIRPATIDDLRNIQELNHELFEEELEEFDKALDLNWTFKTEWENNYKNHIANPNCCAFIVAVNKQIVGYLAGSIIEEKCPYRILPEMAELDDIFILEEYRNMWIGTKLHEAFLGWCKSKNVKKIQVSAYAWNVKAINFYKKLGFGDFAVILEKDI